MTSFSPRMNTLSRSAPAVCLQQGGQGPAADAMTVNWLMIEIRNAVAQRDLA
jgi:hypothetical protein